MGQLFWQKRISLIISFIYVKETTYLWRAVQINDFTIQKVKVFILPELLTL